MEGEDETRENKCPPPPPLFVTTELHLRLRLRMGGNEQRRRKGKKLGRREGKRRQRRRNIRRFREFPKPRWSNFPFPQEKSGAQRFLAEITSSSSLLVGSTVAGWTSSFPRCPPSFPAVPRSAVWWPRLAATFGGGGCGPASFRTHEFPKIRAQNNRNSDSGGRRGGGPADEFELRRERRKGDLKERKFNEWLSFFLSVLRAFPSSKWDLASGGGGTGEGVRGEKKIFLEEGGELRIGKAMEVRNFVSPE